jgi:hypothetical protein
MVAGRSFGSRLPETLGSLAAHDPPVGVFCWCSSCGHGVSLPLAPLLERHGPLLAVPVLRFSMTCDHCGKRDVEVRPDWSALTAAGGPMARHT